MIVPDSITWPLPTTSRTLVIATFWADAAGGISRPMASTGAIARAAGTEVAFTSVDDLAGCLPPRESVGRPLQRHHAQAMVGGIASRVGGDHHDVAELERLARDACAPELTDAGPLDRPPHHLAVLVRRLDVHERMRVAEEELHELALDRDGLVLVIGGGKGMMCPGRDAGPHDGDRQDNEES